MMSPKQMLLLIWFVILLGTLITGAPRSFPPTSCSSTVLETSGNIVCHFGLDLKETKHDFQVQRFDLDPADKDPDRVLMCNWKYPAVLICHVNGNYAFNGNVSDEAVIVIPNFSKETEGRYVCQMIPSDAEVTSCSAILAERRPVPPPTESMLGRSNHLDTPKMDHPQREDAPFSLSQTSLVVIIIAVAVVFGAIVGIVARVVLSHRRKLYEKAGNLPSTENCHQSEEHTSNENLKQPLWPVMSPNSSFLQ